MGRRGPLPKGQIEIYRRKNGLTTFYIRVPYEGRRVRIRLGDESDGWTWARAEIELRNTIARIDAGVWTPPKDEPKPEPTSFHAAASRWLARRKHELRENTYRDYHWRLTRHLLPFFAEYSLDEITADVIDAYKEKKLRDREEILAARAIGATLRDLDGRPLRPLGNESINKTLALLGAILDDAVRKALITTNPARDRATRLRVTRTRGAILEADELVDLIEAAEEIDRRHLPGRAAVVTRIVELRDRAGRSWAEIAADTGLAIGTSIYHYERSRTAMPARLGRRAIVATLGCAGLRVSELCALNWQHIDLAHRKIKVVDAKTDEGVREIDMSPRLVDELGTYRASLGEVSATSPAFPTRRGSRRNKDNVGKRVIQPAVRRANARRAERGLPALPHVTPHTLRRTYISLMLEAGVPVPYVMQQVGHTDSSTTLEIYARVLKRRDRRHMGQAFDELMGGTSTDPPASEDPQTTDDGEDDEESVS